nr:nuclear transport factor 2 family protein [uncultured Dyadobacter sp.]
MYWPAQTNAHDVARRSLRIWGAFLLVYVGCVYTVRSQQIDPDLSLLIQTEKAFAATVSETGIAGAFLAYLDSSGVVFTKGVAVNGMAEYGKVTGNDFLSWYPVIAHVSVSGDLGFTSGPYQYFAEKGQQALSSGYFFSIWKKNTQGKFKVLLDGGAFHTKDHTEAFRRDAEPESNTGYDYILPFAPVGGHPGDVWIEEDNFSKTAAGDMSGAYNRFLAGEVVLLRNNSSFGRNKAHALRTLGEQNIRSYQFTRGGQGISKAGDLAYCFGQVKATGSARQEITDGFFVRIWQHRPEGWKIVADQVCLFR